VKVRWVPVILALLVLLQGCGSRKNDEETVKVYYIRDVTGSVTESAIGAVDMTISRQSDRAKAAMMLLLSDPGVGDLKSPYPEGVSLESVSHRGDTITVDLSEEYGEMYGAELAAADACAVLTLCGINGITSVKFTVKGKPHLLHEKEFFTKSDIVTDDLSLIPVEMQAVLYFSDGDVGYVVPEIKNIIIRENEAIEQYIIEELIKGPSEEEYERILAPETDLISISKENGICYVNFSADFEKGFEGDFARELQTLYSVTNSLCSVEGVDGVQYLVEGERIYGNKAMRSVDSVIGAYSDQAISIPLYVVDRSGRNLVKVPARIETNGGPYIEQLIVEKMIGGIDGHGFLSMMPGGTKLLGIEIDKDTCIINFSQEFSTNDQEDDIDRDLVCQAIALSLKEVNDSIDKIRVQVNGKDIADGIYIFPDRDLVTNG
jgi:germination protein M